MESYPLLECSLAVTAGVTQLLEGVLLLSQATAATDWFDTEFLGVPLFDNDINKLLFRFVVDLAVVVVILRFIYFKHAQSKDYIFTFLMINVLTFFICFTLKKLQLELGMALGLFAIFGILRYRTSTIAIKEMTYLFTFIGIAVINSLSNKNVSYIELAFANASIVALAATLENLSLLKVELRETIRYEKIDLIRPENHDKLIADLEQRTGLKINRIELGRINFLRDTVLIEVFYYPHEQPQSSTANDVEIVVKTDRR